MEDFFFDWKIFSFDRGLFFQGVHLTPEPAYASQQQIFVEGTPFQFPNVLFSEALTGYRKVSSNIFLLKDTPIFSPARGW